MKKLSFILIVLPLFLGSCGKDKNKNSNVSVLENSDSLINQWFGEDHYKDDDMPKKKPCGSIEEETPPLLVTPGGLVSSVEEGVVSSTTPQTQQCFSQYLFTKNALNSVNKEAEE